MHLPFLHKATEKWVFPIWRRSRVFDFDWKLTSICSYQKWERRT
jgi:hypothetical protein